MPIQLTPEQEKRILAVVNAGAFPSAEEALDAAVAAVEIAASHDFEGTREELEALLVEGVNSKEITEEEFWESVDRETKSLLAAEKSGSRW